MAPRVGDAEDRKDVQQPDAESIESKARVRFGLGYNNGRFTPDATDPYGTYVEIKSCDLNSAAPQVQFAHNAYPTKYKKFLGQHLLVIFHRNDEIEEYWLLKKGGQGYWKKWVEHRRAQHRFEHELALQMKEAWKSAHGEPSDAQKKRLNGIVNKAKSGKQWNMSIIKVRKYGQLLTDNWPSRGHMYQPKPILNEDMLSMQNLREKNWK